MTAPVAEPVPSPGRPAPFRDPGPDPASRSGRSDKLIGEIVVDLGFATQDAVEAAVKYARETGSLTGRVLIETRRPHLPPACNGPG